MSPSSEITLYQIRERAYELWERNHRPDGLEIKFWLTAERELKAEHNRQRCRETADAAVAANPGSSTVGASFQ